MYGIIKGIPRFWQPQPDTAGIPHPERYNFHPRTPMPNIYPFTAIAGQERMKRALLLNAVNPRIGGVLIRGERGTAKSTAARSLAALLPEVRSVGGGPVR